jgi:hypothetical protein
LGLNGKVLRCESFNLDSINHDSFHLFDTNNDLLSIVISPYSVAACLAILGLGAVDTNLTYFRASVKPLTRAAHRIRESTLRVAQIRIRYIVGTIETSF